MRWWCYNIIRELSCPTPWSLPPGSDEALLSFLSCPASSKSCSLSLGGPYLHPQHEVTVMALTSRLSIPWHSFNVSTPSSSKPTLPDFLVVPVATVATAFVLVLLTTIFSVRSKPSGPKRKLIPLLNPKRWYELSTARARRGYDKDSWNMTLKGMDAYGGEPFRLLMMELEGGHLLFGCTLSPSKRLLLFPGWLLEAGASAGFETDHGHSVVDPVLYQRSAPVIVP